MCDIRCLRDIRGRNQTYNGELLYPNPNKQIIQEQIIQGGCGQNRIVTKRTKAKLIYLFDSVV